MLTYRTDRNMTRGYRPAGKHVLFVFQVDLRLNTAFKLKSDFGFLKIKKKNAILTTHANHRNVHCDTLLGPGP